MDAQAIDAWISEARFQPFLDAAQNDETVALALYEWHARVGAACLEVTHHFEVLLRNAIDNRLGAGQPDQPIVETWLLDFVVLRPNAVKQVIVAVERLEAGTVVTRGRVVAGVSFGFWVGIFARAYEELWRQELRHAFPHANRRADLATPLQTLRRFRNRLAHHDSILAQDVPAHVEEMFLIASYIDPAARTWLETISQVDAVLAARPI